MARGGRGRSPFTTSFGACPELCRRADGFTLVELLVVSLLLGVISLTTYSGLSVGVKTWKRIEFSMKEVDLAVGWKRFRKDFVAQPLFRAIGFYGITGEVSFPGLVRVTDGEGEVHEEVGRIRYLFDPSAHSLCREVVTYAGLASDGTLECRPVVSDVEKISFEFFGLDEAPGSPGRWRSAWEGEKPPLAVRLKIAFTGPGGKGEIEKQFTATTP